MLGDQEMEQLDKTRFHDKIEYIQGGDPWIGGIARTEYTGLSDVS
jgi:hypothetical protein